MIETSNLQDRVTLTGALRHNKVRDIMIKGNLYNSLPPPPLPKLQKNNKLKYL